MYSAVWRSASAVNSLPSWSESELKVPARISQLAPNSRVFFDASTISAEVGFFSVPPSITVATTMVAAQPSDSL